MYAVAARGARARRYSFDNNNIINDNNNNNNNNNNITIPTRTGASWQTLHIMIIISLIITIIITTIPIITGARAGRHYI